MERALSPHAHDQTVISANSLMNYSSPPDHSHHTSHASDYRTGPVWSYNWYTEKTFEVLFLLVAHKLGPFYVTRNSSFWDRKRHKMTAVFFYFCVVLTDKCCFRISTAMYSSTCTILYLRRLAKLVGKTLYSIAEVRVLEYMYSLVLYWPPCSIFSTSTAPEVTQPDFSSVRYSARSQ